MAVKRLSNARLQYDDGNGALANAYRLFFYASGSSTKQNTYNSSTGGTPNTNPIVLNALGEPAVEIWLTAGLSYKMGLAIPGSDDPPASFVWTEDVITGVNDTSSGLDQWVASGLTPTYVSATSFTLVGDQTSNFQVGRRIKTTNTGGTVYGVITASAFGAVTTVTVLNDSGSLDSGLSAVSYGLLSATNPSTPNIIVGSFTGTASQFTVAQTGTIKYTKIGNSVILEFPGFSGTSNATGFTVTGFPAAIQPASTKTILVSVQDAGSGFVISGGAVSAGGLSISASLNGAAFTNSGTKSLAAGSICYTLA